MGREDSGAAAKRSVENLLDSKTKTQRVLQVYCVNAGPVCQVTYLEEVHCHCKVLLRQ